MGRQGEKKAESNRFTGNYGRRFFCFYGRECGDDNSNYEGCIRRDKS